MNITYSIDKILCIVTLNYTGNPDFDEWANTMRAVFRDPNFEPGFSVILDRRLVTTAGDKFNLEECYNVLMPTGQSVSSFVGKHLQELGIAYRDFWPYLPDRG